MYHITIMSRTVIVTVVILAQYVFVANGLFGEQPIDTKSWPYNKDIVLNKNWKSPIDIPTDYVQVLDVPILWFHMNFLFTDQNVAVVNNGRRVEVILDTNVNIPYLTDGILYENKFLFSRMIVNWGDTPLSGSENGVNSFFYAMEIELLFYNRKYDSYEKAQGKPDGLAIASYFGHGNPYNNTDMDYFFDLLPSITKPNSKVEASFGKALMFLRDAANGSYFAYPGTTTSDQNSYCTWMVFKEPFQVGIQQVALFSSLMGTNGQPITSTVSDVQDILDRPIITPRVSKPVQIDPTGLFNF